MTVGEMFEETLLHTFEKMPRGGAASPHTDKTLSHIEALKKTHGISYDTHASYRFVETSRRRQKKREIATANPRASIGTWTFPINLIGYRPAEVPAPAGALRQGRVVRRYVC